MGGGGWRCLRGRHHCGRQSADGEAGFMGELGSWWYNWKELEDGAGERGLVWKPCLWRSVPGCALKPSFLSVHFLQHTFHPLYHRPQKPVLLYTNRNGRFSSPPPRRDLWNTVFTLLLCHICQHLVLRRCFAVWGWRESDGVVKTTESEIGSSAWVAFNSYFLCALGEFS